MVSKIMLVGCIFYSNTPLNITHTTPHHTTTSLFTTQRKGRRYRVDEDATTIEGKNGSLKNTDIATKEVITHTENKNKAYQLSVGEHEYRHFISN